MSVLNQYLETIPTEQHALIRTLHTMIIKAVPNLDSSLKWGNLTYHADHNFCAIVAHKHHVNLQLWNGSSLKDPCGLLSGTGKTMRHVKCTTDSDIDLKYLAGLVKQAAQIS